MGQEDPLEKEMATHSSSCLENPMDRGTSRAVVHGVTKNQTLLKHLTRTHELIAAGLVRASDHPKPHLPHEQMTPAFTLFPS